MNDRIYYSKEAADYAQKQRMVMISLAALVGVGIGTLIAMLLAPQSGEETRKSMEDNMNHYIDQGRETANQVAKDAQKTAGKVRENLNDNIDKIRAN
ncbi:MAG: YtxH domain-containing protein [Aggregatilineales bacterium]